MKTFHTLAAASALTLIVTGPALATQHEGQTGAASQTTDGMFGGQTATSQEMDLRRTSKIVGGDVENTQGESIGEIKDIVIGADGRVSYVAVSSGGALGVGGDLHPVPWQALRWDAQKGKYILNVKKDAFKSAPTFSSDNWPVEPNSTWVDFYRQQGISEAFGATDSSTMSPAM